jgi:16S rRNA (guanine527-N7)-methyltransferase
VLDVGTGGGVPGIVLAILRDDLDISLCESVQKKARVVEQFVRQLELPCAVHAERAEKLLDDFRYDVLVARAVGPIVEDVQVVSAIIGRISVACWLSRGRAGSTNERRRVNADCCRRSDCAKSPRTRCPEPDSESVILRLEAAN